MKLILDATALTTYPFAKPAAFSGGTELACHKLAAGLAERGHTVHVVCPDLESEEQRGPTLWYWPAAWHPTSAEAVIMAHNLANIAPYSADLLLLLSNGLGAFLGPDDEYATGVDGVGCLSQYHVDVLCRQHRKVARGKCFVTGLGVDADDYLGTKGLDCGACINYELQKQKKPGRFLYANDPMRGLWHALDIFDKVRAEVPDATLHVTYDFDQQFSQHTWNATAMAEYLWECKRRLESTPGVTNCGGLTRDEMIREQLEAQVFLFPCDVTRVGAQLHSLSGLEAAAAGCALVLSDAEALPEIFEDVADIMYVPGRFHPAIERRWTADDWAERVVELLRNPTEWAEASRKARALAERHPWSGFVAAWEAKLVALMGERGTA